MTAWQFERPPGLPVPQPAAEAQPFFDALKEHRLVIQRCTSCDTLTHPPRAMCGGCRNTNFAWRQVSGEGTVYSYVVTHQAVHPALVGHTPMATVEVKLAEGPRLVSNMLDVPPDAIAIGMPVRVAFVDVGDGVVLPFFSAVK